MSRTAPEFRYLSALIGGAFRGAGKEELLSSRFSPADGYWEEEPLHPVIDAIANGSFRQKESRHIKGTGYAADALEAALWAFYSSGECREGCLLAVNLGDDADTTAAIYGQIAGAFYGESESPEQWTSRLALKPLLDRYAELLFSSRVAIHRPPVLHRGRARKPNTSSHVHEPFEGMTRAASPANIQGA